MVARWSFFGYNRCMVRTAHWGWTWRLPTGLIQSNPVHIPVYTPLRCSEWYSTRPSRNTLERAVVVLWYHCGTLRLAENISGVGSQTLKPNGIQPPTTHRDTASDILTDWSVISKYHRCTIRMTLTKPFDIFPL